MVYYGNNNVIVIVIVIVVFVVVTNSCNQSICFINILLYRIQPEDHGMLSMSENRVINVQCLTPSPLAMYSWYQFYRFMNMDTKVLIVCLHLLIRKSVVSGLKPGPSGYEASVGPHDHNTRFK